MEKKEGRADVREGDDVHGGEWGAAWLRYVCSGMGSGGYKFRGGWKHYGKGGTKEQVLQ